MRYLPIIQAVPFLAALFLAADAAAQVTNPPAIPPTLQDVSGRIQTRLDAIDVSLKGAAVSLANEDLDSDAARKTLRDLLAAQPCAIDVCTVNPWGRVVAAEPEPYRYIEGKNIRRQEQIRRLYQTHKPVMSLVIDTVEGVRAVDFEYPIFRQDGMFAGSVSMLVRHETLLDEIIRPMVQALPVDIWVMQTDGTILYSNDPERIGVNVFKDSPYQTRGPLLGVAQRVASEPSGAATYDIETPNQMERIKKSLYWTRAGLYGTEWRVSLVRVLEGDPAAAKGEFEDLQLMLARDALRRLCAKSLVRRYMRGDNTVGMRRELESFYEAYPFLYSVQWLDAGGVTRFGCPEEHSLRDFDHTRLRSPGDREFLDALKDGKERWTVTDLRGGGHGVLYLCPVRSGNVTLGMIYFISLLNDEDGAASRSP